MRPAAKAIIAGYFGVIKNLLPGDHIHDRAPINLKPQSETDKQAALDAAQAKRDRKNAKRLARA